MFRFSSRPEPAHADPLLSPRTAADWLRELPALDVAGRQEHVIGALGRLRETRTSFDLDRVGALLTVDAALTADHRRLLTWYLENLARSPTLADRFWQMARVRNHSFIDAYRRALATALGNLPDRQWKALLPRLASRLVHLHGVDLTLGLFRTEPAGPAMWKELHGLFLRMVELGIERTPAALPGDDPLARHPLIEHEYVNVLLLDLLHTGNLTAAEIDWAGTQLYGWSRDLALLPQPVAKEGFVVDFTRAGGLSRHSGAPAGAKVAYLDTAPLEQELERTLAALRAPAVADEAYAGPLRLQRIAVLEKIRPAIAPMRSANLRRHRRFRAELAAEVCIGLGRIVHRLVPPDPGALAPVRRARLHPVPRPAKPPPAIPSPAARRSAVPPPASTLPWPDREIEEIEIRPLADDDLQWNEPEPVAPRAPSAAKAPVALRPVESPWRIDDRSVAGLRIATSGGAGHSMALGALVAVLPEDADEWMLGVVRRLIRDESLEIAAGLSVIARRIAPVVLHGLRHPPADMSFIVDGIDVATLGPRFDGLYLTPTEELESQFVGSTLIVPTSEHFDGRHVILTTANAEYAVTLGRVIETQHEWSWVAVRIAAKVPHGD